MCWTWNNSFTKKNLYFYCLDRGRACTFRITYTYSPLDLVNRMRLFGIVLMYNFILRFYHKQHHFIHFKIKYMFTKLQRSFIRFNTNRCIATFVNVTNEEILYLWNWKYVIKVKCMPSAGSKRLMRFRCGDVTSRSYHDTMIG